jgi:membrane-associated protease RseP (regulator of RpoE activity)
MNFLGIPLWERRVNGFQKPATNGWRSHPVSREEPAPAVSRMSPPVRSHGTVRIHIVLFLITVATTLVAGMLWAGIADPMTHLEQLSHGIPYAGTLLAILFCHEMGHYVTARYYGMDVTLPYFLPGPPSIMGMPFLGTFGAVIRMKSPPQHRRALLHVGAAGPIAGFCVALPAMIYALATATQVPMDTTRDGLYFASPLLLHILGYIVIGPIPSGMTLTINSVGVAAWFGLLVTVLNLLPIGQLDGGHIIYALLGRQARYVSRAAIGALLGLGLLGLAWPGWGWPGWILWAFLGWLSSRRQPVVLDQHAPLSRYSQVIVGIAFTIFVLCFMPIPFQVQ